jgi:hypothetical protein
MGARRHGSLIQLYFNPPPPPKKKDPNPQNIIAIILFTPRRKECFYRSAIIHAPSIIKKLRKLGN